MKQEKDLPHRVVGGGTGDAKGLYQHLDQQVYLASQDYKMHRGNGNILEILV